jgi:hypothetical protein
MVDYLTTAKCNETISAVRLASTRGLSRTYNWAAGVLGFRSPRQIDQFARKLNITLTNRDRTHIEHALKGRGRVKPDPASMRTPRRPRELWAQDPVTYKAPLYGGITTIFFTIDVGTARVRVYGCKSKTSKNAIRALQDYGRLSRTWKNDTHQGPHLVQTDDDSIYKSVEFTDFLRHEAIIGRRSAPYHHRQNSQVEKPIGIIHGSAMSMIHAVTWTGSLRKPIEFLLYALSHQCHIDSMLSPRGDDSATSPHVAELRADGTTAEVDFTRIQHPWGSKCFVVLERASQLSDRGRYGYYLGVSESHRTAMYVYIPQTDQVITSQDVYFDSEFPFTLIPSLADDGLYEITLDELPPLPQHGQSESPQCSWNDEQESVLNRSSHTNPVSDGQPTPEPRSLLSRVAPVGAPTSAETIPVENLNETCDAVGVPPSSDFVSRAPATAADTTSTTISSDTSVGIKRDYLPTDAIRDGHPQNTTVNEAGELIIGINPRCASGMAVYDDVTCNFFPTWDDKALAARGYNTCATISEWGTTDWLYDPLTVDEGTTIDDATTRQPIRWEDRPSIFDETQALSYILHAPRDLYVRHSDGFLSELHVARFHSEDDIGVATDAAAFATMSTESPQSLTAALRSSDPTDRLGYQAAAEKEMDGHLDNDTWTDWVGPLPPGKTPLRTKLFFVKKLGKDGKLASYKARLVVLGNRQKPEDFDQISSPIPKEASINTFFTLVASEDLDTIHVDWSQAFVSAPADREIWVILPKEYGSKLVLLNRQLYGLRQAAYQFHHYVVTKLAAQGLHQLPSEQCLFQKFIYPRQLTPQGDESDTAPWFGDVSDDDLDSEGRLLSDNIDVYGNRVPVKIVALLWVDDFVIASTYRNKDVDLLIDALKRDFKITVDKFEWFLKCHVIRDRPNKTLYVSQAVFATQCVEAILGVPVDKVKKTHGMPLPEGYFPSGLGQCKSVDDHEFMLTKKDLYRSHVAKLLWLCRTRQELRFSVSALCKFMGSPGPQHWSDLKRVARYIASNVEKGLKFTAVPESVMGYSDADWGSDPTTRKSVSGYWVTFLGCTAHSVSKRQRLIAMSTFESELIAAREAACTVVWMRRLTTELGYNPEGPSILWVDNQAVLTVEDSVMQSWRCRAIPLRYFALKSFCDDGLLTLMYIQTDENPSDIFTKQIGKALWEKHESRLSSTIRG